MRIFLPPDCFTSGQSRRVLDIDAACQKREFVGIERQHRGMRLHRGGDVNRLALANLAVDRLGPPPAINSVFRSLGS